ncbi:hypothetical protein EKK58_11705 [Candidatus Dependentiae bacterium]|nr:MAG: hypothetical protein EKK58_11705 [Candidatus Dependentiae bacterium]
MFGILNDIAKAAVGVVTSPIAVTRDVLSATGITEETSKSYTEQQLKDILKNLENAAKSSK